MLSVEFYEFCCSYAVNGIKTDINFDVGKFFGKFDNRNLKLMCWFLLISKNGDTIHLIYYFYHQKHQPTYRSFVQDYNFVWFRNFTFQQFFVQRIKRRIRPLTDNHEINIAAKIQFSIQRLTLYNLQEIGIYYQALAQFHVYITLQEDTIQF